MVMPLCAKIGALKGNPFHWAAAGDTKAPRPRRARRNKGTLRAPETWIRLLTDHLAEKRAGTLALRVRWTSSFLGPGGSKRRAADTEHMSINRNELPGATVVARLQSAILGYRRSNRIGVSRREGAGQERPDGRRCAGDWP